MSADYQLEKTLPQGFPGVFGVMVRLMSDRKLRRSHKPMAGPPICQKRKRSRGCWR
jgi:hypothetical protein